MKCAESPGMFEVVVDPVKKGPWSNLKHFNETKPLELF